MRPAGWILVPALLTLLAASPIQAQSTDEAQQRATLRRHRLVAPDDPQQAAAVTLGRKLYFDARLSADGLVSCATCHDVTLGLTDRRPVAVGLGGARARRNTPTTANAALLPVLFHDGRATTLEEQAALPILNPVEMGHATAADAVAAIASDVVYRRLFDEAYGRPPAFDDLARALAAFQRTLIYLNAPYDRWRRGEADALTPSARRGAALFSGRAGCTRCHTVDADPALFTDAAFHNTGVSARAQPLEPLLAQAEAAAEAPPVDHLALGSELEALGRYLVTRQRRDAGAFRTAPLRNVGVTAPYMHDGSLATLWDVVDHYAAGGVEHALLDPAIEPLALTPAERDDLVAFLLSLTDDRFAAQQARELARQRALRRR